MKISVVIPNFNDLRIKRSFDSLFAQSYKNFEVIVADGGSTDERLLKIYESHKIDVLIHERDEGIFDALNKGIDKASGDIIFLMGSDDYLADKDVFSDVVQRFQAKNLLQGVCIGCEFVNAKGEVIRSWRPNKVSSSRIKWGILPPHFSLFLKRGVYQSVGKFNFKESNNIACDIFWMLDMGIALPELLIDVLKEHYLVMQYGGASTGSFRAVWMQFLFSFRYSFKRRMHLPVWFVFSPIRTFSKIFQFRFFK